MDSIPEDSRSSTSIEVAVALVDYLPEVSDLYLDSMAILHRTHSMDRTSHKMATLWQLPRRMASLPSTDGDDRTHSSIL